MKERNSTDTIFYKATQYIYYFLLTNTYFLVSNVLILSALIFLPLSISNLLIYGVALIPTGASMTALFYVMGKLYREKTIQPTKEYWRAYLSNFKESTKYWALIILVLVILSVDILYVLERGWLFLTIISLIALAILTVTIIYAFSILARFEVTTKNLVIFSILLLFRNKLNSLSLLFLLVAFMVIFYGFAGYALLFIFSVSGYYFMRSNHKILEKLMLDFQ
ncbi:DUF624 domain-containing protein [Marinilactibacillus kalidii]|uniref:DUF624 domain-containing protein n=1 Tax=Marinilactibacillus kalidii TaxID=2820274 RepID=UPI001ABE9415|nr:DUF624 domain-containing protein [Marinilactibacillus kalidii]